MNKTTKPAKPAIRNVTIDNPRADGSMPNGCRISEIWKVGDLVFKITVNPYNCLTGEVRIYAWAPTELKWNGVANEDDIPGLVEVTWREAMTEDDNGNWGPSELMLKNAAAAKNYMFEFAKTIK